MKGQTSILTADYMGELRTDMTFLEDAEGDPIAMLDILASLAGTVTELIDSTAAEALAEGCTYAELADVLGITRQRAHQRYGPTA